MTMVTLGVTASTECRGPEAELFPFELRQEPAERSKRAFQPPIAAPPKAPRA